MKKRSIFDIDIDAKIDREFAEWQKQSKIRYEEQYEKLKESLRTEGREERKDMFLE